MNKRKRKRAKKRRGKLYEGLTSIWWEIGVQGLL